MAVPKSTQPWVILKPAAHKKPPVRLKHGMTNTTEYSIWGGIKKRCYNPRACYYHRYGGRGIKMCERWAKSFAAFYADMGPRPSIRHQIERIDNDGDYTPENCRWATQKEQGRNKCNNTLVIINGEKLTLAAWNERLGINPGVMEWRARRNGTTAAEELVKAVQTGNLGTGRRRLSDEVVNRIKDGLAKGESMRSIASRLGVSKTAVAGIRDGKRKDGYRV